MQQRAHNPGPAHPYTPASRFQPLSAAADQPATIRWTEAAANGLPFELR